MSHVYMARDTVIGRTVAVKILTDQGAADEDTRARFIREAQLAGNVIHDNIIRVYQFDEEAGRYYMVMEFLEGEDLSDAIKNRRVGDAGTRLAIALQIARAMEYVHSMQIVHRDLKPHNIYLTKSGTAKLMDFGIAKTDQTSLTRPGFTIGTPSYMAPEQVRGGVVNHLSDIYAFGILLFEMLTGSKAFGGDTVDRVFWQILNEPVNLMQLREVAAPERVIRLIARCTEKEQGARPQNFGEIRQELEEINGKPHLPSRVQAEPSPVQPAKPAWLIPGLAVLAVVLIAAVGLYVWRSGQSTKDSARTADTSTKASFTKPASTLAFPSGDMVLVPAGTFLFGKEKMTREVGDYYVDRDEVSNAAYGKFLSESGHAAPPGFGAGKPTEPVVNVTIADARAFAKWAGKRLVNSVEWEKAARGEDGRSYPWGESTTVLDQASPHGTRNMSGGIFELVDEQIVPSEAALKYYASRLSPKPTASEPWCTMRGGSMGSQPAPVYESGSVPERFRGPRMGFRCGRNVQ